MNPSNRNRLTLLFLVSVVGYIVMGYGIERSNFTALISIFGLLFACYYFFIRWVDESIASLKWLIAAAVVFRLTLLFSIPNLSDDFYRFIWDGNLWVNGINPFLHTPDFYMQNGLPEFLSAELFQNLNSPSYYTVYPPVNQYVFGLAASIFGTALLGNVITMRLIILGAEIGSIIILKKLLHHFELSPKWLLVYALNPLIILELTGNLHFEAVMIFFLLLGYYLFLKERLWLAAGCFAIAVNTKLLPLILLPYLVFSLGWKKSSGLVGVLAVGTMALHLPFLDQAFVQNFSDSLGLYFQSFEFNASIYYAVRWVGFQMYDYNIIQWAAPRLALLSTLLIVGISWLYRQKSLKNLPAVYITCFGIYYLFSTTVHPWYVTSLIAFAPLAGLMFPLAWSSVISLTYFAYRTPAYTENLWLVALEYAVVLAFVAYDWYRRDYLVEENNDWFYSFVSSA